MNDPRSNLAKLILVIDEDVLSRSQLASYIREMGSKVIEVASEADARVVLDAGKYSIAAVIYVVRKERSAKAFAFTRWVRTHHSPAQVFLASNVARAKAAGVKVGRRISSKQTR